MDHQPDPAEDPAVQYLEEVDGVATFVGELVVRRFSQLERGSMNGLPASLIAGVAAADIWKVIDESDDPDRAIPEFFALEEALLP